MADREAARRQRLRGAGRDLAPDADISFGFGLVAPAAVAATTTAEIIETEIAVHSEARNINATATNANLTIRTAEQTREDARRQRLRGAQTRSPGVGAGDFAFELPAAPERPAPVETAKTPAPARVQDTTTPAVPTTAKRGRGRSRKSVPGEEPQQATTAQTPAPAKTTGTQGVSTTAKRERGRPRKSMPADETREDTPASKRQRLSSPPPPVDDSTMRQQTPDQSTTQIDAVRSSPRRPPSTKSRPRDIRDFMARQEEVAESPREAPGSGQRRRVTAAEKAAAREAQNLTSPGRSRKTNQRVGSPTLTDNEIEANRPKEVSVVESIEGEPEPEEVATPIPDARAAAELLARRKTKGKAPARRSPTPLSDSASEFEEDEIEESIAVPAKKKRGRPPKSPAVQKPPMTKAQKRAAEAVANESIADESTLMPIRKRGRPKGSTNRGSTSASQPKPKRRGGLSRETIPIAAYRLAPLIPGDEENLPLGREIPENKKSKNVPNSADVLNQILAELLQSALGSLESGAIRADEIARLEPSAENREERREYRTKLRALEEWGEEIRARLVGLRVALDNRSDLQQRVKGANREKVELRKELLRIRKDREAVQLRMDAVRMRHEKESGEAREVGELNTMLGDIGVAVGMGREVVREGDREMAEETVDKRVEKVVGLASSASSDGGLLKRLRGMNAVLERAAEALEGR